MRIGIATAKGISCGANAALYGTSTLDAAAFEAWKAGARGKIFVVADAMRGEVYPGLYLADDEKIERSFAAERVLKVDACIEELEGRADKDELILTGDGLKKYADKFKDAGFTNFVDQQSWWPSAEGLFYSATEPFIHP